MSHIPSYLGGDRGEVNKHVLHLLFLQLLFPELPDHLSRLRTMEFSQKTNDRGLQWQRTTHRAP